MLFSLHSEHKLNAGNWPMYDLDQQFKKSGSKQKLIVKFHNSVLARNLPPKLKPSAQP